MNSNKSQFILLAFPYLHVDYQLRCASVFECWYLGLQALQQTFRGLQAPQSNNVRAPRTESMGLRAPRQNL